MPNYNYNYVTIDAKYEEVCAMFVKSEKPNSGWFFNMYLLFPDHFPENDPFGDEYRDYDWCIENTGSKWLPEISIEDQGDEVVLSYDSAWTPNNGTLLKLSELTGWWIHNEYEEPGCWFEGTYTCKSGKVIEDEQGEYQPECDTCGYKHDEKLMSQDEETCEWICSTCEKKDSAGKGEKP